MLTLFVIIMGLSLGMSSQVSKDMGLDASSNFKPYLSNLTASLSCVFGRLAAPLWCGLFLDSRGF